MSQYRTLPFFVALFLLSFSGVANSTSSSDTIPGLPLPGINLQSGMVMKSQFPAPKVWIDMMPTIDPEPKEAPAVNVYMTLTNSTGYPVTYTFPSSQTFDIFLKDLNGNTQTSWSIDKSFLQVITTLTIPAGGSQMFGGSLKLGDTSGQAINPGDYTLSIRLMNSSITASGYTTNNNPSSQMPLRIDWAY